MQKNPQEMKSFAVILIVLMSLLVKMSNGKLQSKFYENYYSLFLIPTFNKKDICATNAIHLMTQIVLTYRRNQMSLWECDASQRKEFTKHAIQPTFLVSSRAFTGSGQLAFNNFTIKYLSFRRAQEAENDSRM